MVTTKRGEDRIVDLLEEYASNPNDYDVYKTAAEIRQIVRAEDDRSELGAEQAHEEYELTKKPWWAK